MVGHLRKMTYNGETRQRTPPNFFSRSFASDICQVILPVATGVMSNVAYVLTRGQ